MMLLAFGRRRRGKSTLVFHLAHLKGKKIVIYDPNSQFYNGLILTDVEELARVLNSDEADDIPPVIIYRPKDDPWAEFEAFARVLWPRGGYSLIVDEAHRLQKAQKVHPWLDIFIRQAPTDEDEPYTVHILQAMHRPQDSNGIVFSQATHIAIFRFTKQRDLEVIEHECGKDCRDAVEALDGRQFVLYNVDDETFEVITDDKEWYEPIRTDEQVEAARQGEESVIPFT